MRAALRSRDFRLLWLGQTASTVGDRMVLVALGLFIAGQSGNPADLGIVLAAYSAPLVLFLLVGGVFADRLPRHRIMVVSDLARCGLHAGLAVLILAGGVSIGLVAAIEALFGGAEAFFRPAYTGLLPQTVPEGLIQEARSISSLSETFADFAGPALATALVVGPGAGWAFAFDASTFLVSAALVAQVRPRRRGSVPVRQTLLRELADGYRHVRSRPWVSVTIAVFSFALLVGLAPYFVVGPKLAEDQYGEASVYGIVATAIGVGSIAGAFAGLRWRPKRPLRTAFIAIGAWPLQLLLFGLGAPLVLLLGAAALMGTGFALFIVWWDTALAERIPPEALSRVSAYDWMGSLALMPLGYLGAAALSGRLDPDEIALGGAALTALALALGLLPRETRQLARSEQPVTRAAQTGPAIAELPRP